VGLIGWRIRGRQCTCVVRRTTEQATLDHLADGNGFQLPMGMKLAQ
jgi:hypothetical protein